MKNILYTLVFTISLSCFGQQNERIKTLKIAFITERLQLTEAEAQQFWPIYNAFEKGTQTLRQETMGKFRTLDPETLSEEEAQQHLQTVLKNEDKRHALKQQFTKDLMRVLPAKKIILLKATEEAFKRRMMERFKNRARGFERDRP